MNFSGECACHEYNAFFFTVRSFFVMFSGSAHAIPIWLEDIALVGDENKGVAKQASPARVGLKVDEMLVFTSLYSWNHRNGLIFPPWGYPDGLNLLSGFYSDSRRPFPDFDPMGFPLLGFLPGDVFNANHLIRTAPDGETIAIFLLCWDSPQRPGRKPGNMQTELSRSRGQLTSQ